MALNAPICSSDFIFLLAIWLTAALPFMLVPDVLLNGTTPQ
jgi:hypothetical protein